MNISEISDKMTAPNFDFMGNELLRFVRANYRAYCPKCHSVLSYSERSDDDYLGACVECDEDFYAIECNLEES